MIMNRSQSRFLTLAIAAVCLALSSAAAISAQQQTFTSPGLATNALIDALKKNDPKMLGNILGDSEDVISSGDSVADNTARLGFLRSYDQMHRLEYDDSGRVILYVGADNWPLPIPIVKQGNAWRFDTAAGKEELLFRRVGRNELLTIDTLEELVEAQQEYAEGQRDSAGATQYAQKIFSDPDKKNGLYWPTSDGGAASPIGALIAQATAEGYQRDPSGKPVPFHGYYYKVLTSQGTDAPGGAINYIADGKMTGGFAFLAYPAEYRASGVNTFMVNASGVIVEKDLGPDTEKIAASINSFSPDSSWDELDQPDDS
jgi:hypothetical protein